MSSEFPGWVDEQRGVVESFGRRRLRRGGGALRVSDGDVTVEAFGGRGSPVEGDSSSGGFKEGCNRGTIGKVVARKCHLGENEEVEVLGVIGGEKLICAFNVAVRVAERGIELR